MSPIKVAVVGATGNAGIPIVNELLAAGHLVTALSRPGSTSSSKLPKHPNLSVTEVDYNSLTSITSALEGYKVVIACVPVAAAVGSQDVLIDACIAAGVTRFFPAEFGTDTENPKCRKLPIFDNKIQTLEYLKAKVATNPSFSYTALCPGAFLDWGFEVGFLVSPKTHSATIYDGGDLPFSTTTTATIGKAVVSIINHLEETKNRHVYIHDAVVTQNKLIAMAKKLDGKEWNLTHITCAEAEARAYEELKKDKPDITKGLFPLLHLSVLAEGYGGDFSEHLDNELLGIKGMSDEEIEDLLAKYL
ncbi:hypothetical protein F5884DRAFT_441344 [Xylogone sp. PMI_703]|nr:hypothetical protein F5884DRAFT_441344 [Xylogone sp. PMI_703]